MRTDKIAPEGGPALFRLVRFWSRRWATGAGMPKDDPLGHVLVLEAIDAARRDGNAQIADVAMELGLDRSNASRMLAAAAAAGLVTKMVSSEDARRTELSLTTAGRQLLKVARAWQERTFEQLTEGWSPADARRLASYLVRLAAEQTHRKEKA